LSYVTVIEKGKMERSRGSKTEKSLSENVYKKEAVPLHAMEAHGGRGGIAPTHS
jgi:hypothetical protein